MTCVNQSLKHLQAVDCEAPYNHYPHVGEPLLYVMSSGSPTCSHESPTELVADVCRPARLVPLQRSLTLETLVCLMLKLSHPDVFSQVLQKLGKTMETKDEQFELCFQNLNKQQVGLHQRSTFFNIRSVCVLVLQLSPQASNKGHVKPASDVQQLILPSNTSLLTLESVVFFLLQWDIKPTSSPTCPR